MTKIYTLGGKSMEWRIELQMLIHSKTSESMSYIHSPKYTLNHKEYFKWFISKVRDCDVVVLNLDDIDNDDTKYDIIAINTINLIDNKHIFVVGYGEEKNLSPLVRDTLFHTEKTLEGVADYITTILMA